MLESGQQPIVDTPLDVSLAQRFNFALSISRFNDQDEFIGSIPLDLTRQAKCFVDFERVA